jgi:hypothetical protein
MRPCCSSAFARKIARSAALSVAFALVGAPAWACDCVTLLPGGPNFSRDLDAIANFYPIAAEGVVEADGPYAWRFRPTREYRGTKQASYRIELSSDCSLAPDEMKALIGKPVFLLLSGGPDRYEAGRCVNSQSPEVEDAIRARIGAGCRPR